MAVAEDRGFGDPCADPADAVPRLVEKLCPACMKRKPAEDFPESDHSPDGRFYYCRQCYERYSKDPYFLPKACWIRGRHSKHLMSDEGASNLLADLATVSEFMARCYRYHCRTMPPEEPGPPPTPAQEAARKRREERRVLKESYARVPLEPAKKCSHCGQNAGRVRTSWLSSDGRFRNCRMVCQVCKHAWTALARPEGRKRRRRPQRPDSQSQ